ncbi:DUF1493 family protein [Rahnella aquatilis]|uniref:DUF1493 family protein n=1 Tax=Rahnella aquatilis TaxID=34038 RepID=UPI0006456B0A|nr:DUF1493 family protein [Rahnella aquatilis]
MRTTDKVLAFFKREIPDSTVLFSSKKHSIGPDSVLQDFEDEPYYLAEIIEKFQDEFNVDMSSLDWNAYFPYEEIGIFDWIMRRKDKLIRKPGLTIEMFVKSAEAGRWLYD